MKLARYRRQGYAVLEAPDTSFYSIFGGTQLILVPKEHVDYMQQVQQESIRIYMELFTALYTKCLDGEIEQWDYRNKCESAQKLYEARGEMAQMHLISMGLSQEVAALIRSQIHDYRFPLIVEAPGSLSGISGRRRTNSHGSPLRVH
jgi:hypothetical protein